MATMLEELLEERLEELLEELLDTGRVGIDVHSLSRCVVDVASASRLRACEGGKDWSVPYPECCDSGVAQEIP